MTVTVTINPSTKIFLSIGIILMFILLLIRRKKYSLSVSKAICSFIAIVICGIFGIFLMFFLENGIWGGISFFGSILIGPLLLIPLSYCFKFSSSEVLSWCAPSVCVVHILCKVNCYITGCCSGNEIYNSIFNIPLQFLEALLILLIMMVLFILEKLNMEKKNIFPLYLILYGIVRLFLNKFRTDLSIFLFVSAGEFWSIVAIIIGILFLIHNSYMLQSISKSNNV